MNLKCNQLMPISSPTIPSDSCRGSDSNERIQSFPKRGDLAKNLNLTRNALSRIIANHEGSVYSYVLSTVRMDSSHELFEQRGSAPNFQGGLLTLCTCKHSMRANMKKDADGLGNWVAGFTSRGLRNGKGTHWLFYLTRVKSTFDSHAELWQHTSEKIRKCKSAKDHFLGDMLEPLGPLIGDERFDPRCYQEPGIHSHRSGSDDKRWHNDIRYPQATRFGYPALLVGDPKLTYLWDRPLIAFEGPLGRGYRKWGSLADFFSHCQ